MEAFDTQKQDWMQKICFSPDELVNVNMYDPVCQMLKALEALACGFDASLYPGSIVAVWHKGDVVPALLPIKLLHQVCTIGGAVIINDEV